VAGAAPEPDVAPAPAAESPAQGAAPELADPPAGAEGIDVAALIAAGFAPDEVERFRERVDAIELERLYLRDQAAREGWLGTGRFSQESQRLDAAMNGLRGEFDEELYDWMLFASGSPNRVAVTEVLADSAAAEAGLRPGDVLVRYDDRLVLTPLELREATAGGEVGSWVAVEVQRGDESMRVLLPRGPLGVRLEPRALQPPPAG
jgi:membrane-associated protease RseP (regulator of RpoE activity)